MAEYIERESLYEKAYWHGEHPDVGNPFPDGVDAIDIKDVDAIPAADVAQVVHGRWELTTHSFYRDTFDESCELCVYIVANCSECSENHPNSHQVFSKTLYAPDDADDDFRFDQKAEEEKALLEFRNKKYEFAYYCPNCGAKMDGDDNA